MSIQYATGTIVFENAWTQTGSPSIKTELCSRIYENFITAGWTSVSVTGSSGSRTAFTVRCVATATESLQCEVHCDTSSTNCVRLYMQEINGNHPQGGGFFLLPATSKVWYMVINRHQFFIWTKGVSACREVACGGTLYIPPFLHGLVTIAIWGQGNAAYDTDTTAGRNTFRIGLNAFAGASQSYQNINGSWWEANNQGSTDSGSQRLVITTSAAYTWSQQVLVHRWHDDSIIVSDPLMGWGPISSGQEGKIRGQLWDSFVSGDAWPGDTTITYDSRTYIAFTNGNVGASQNYAPGTLWLATT